MLVLTRQVGERIFIGEDIELEVCDIKGHKVRIGITAPKDISIVRDDAIDRRPRDRDAA